MDSKAAAGVSGVDATTRNPSGARVMVSKWLIHTTWLSGLVSPNEERLVVDLGSLQVGAAVLAPAGLGHLAAEVAGEELAAVADAEDGDAGVVDLLVDRRARPRRGPTPDRRRR